MGLLEKLKSEISVSGISVSEIPGRQIPSVEKSAEGIFPVGFSAAPPAGPVPPAEPCPVCACRWYWLDAYSLWHCQQCDPPLSPRFARDVAQAGHHASPGGLPDGEGGARANADDGDCIQWTEPDGRHVILDRRYAGPGHDGYQALAGPPRGKSWDEWWDFSRPKKYVGKNPPKKSEG